MAQRIASGVAQAERERELTKRQLADNLDRLEHRIREDFDWKRRLRRDGARYAVVAAGVGIVIAAAAAARRASRSHGEEPLGVDSLEDIAAELHALRRQLRKEKGSDGMFQKLALRGIAAAGAAAGSMVARSMIHREHDSAEAEHPYVQER